MGDARRTLSATLNTNRERVRQIERMLEECAVAIEDRRDGDAALVANLMIRLVNLLEHDLLAATRCPPMARVGTPAETETTPASDYRGHPLGHEMYNALTDLQREEAEASDPGREAWLSGAALRCRCCPVCGDPPCEACLAGGVCDAVDCYCNEEAELDDADEDAP